METSSSTDKVVIVEIPGELGLWFSVRVNDWSAHSPTLFEVLKPSRSSPVLDSVLLPQMLLLHMLMMSRCLEVGKWSTVAEWFMWALSSRRQCVAKRKKEV